MYRALTTLTVGIFASFLMWQPTRAQSSPLSVFFTVDQFVYQPGEPISFTIRVQNVSSQPVAINFATAQRFDVILQSSAATVGRWSNGQIFAQATGEQTWRPGQTIVYEDSWLPTSGLLPGAIGGGAQPLMRGLFELHAELTGITVQPTSPPVPIVIGWPIALDTGCTELDETLTAEVDADTLARTVEPRDALKSLWQEGRGDGPVDAYSPRYAAASDLQQLIPREPITVCVDRPSQITLP
ncbi:MAG: BsuPI-related putative proteinase inhibitor [Dehalococcoidia bacterium]